MGTILKPRYYIAIDPDVKASGLAILDTIKREVSVTTKSFPDLIEYLRETTKNITTAGENYVVIVEDSWTSGSNWHITRGKSMYYYASMGESVGRCHEVGILALECLHAYNVNAKGVPPLQLRVKGRNLWKGRDGKITHEEFCEVTGYTAKRSNQEERDAGLLAWCNAGFPVKVTPQKPLIERKMLEGVNCTQNAQKCAQKA